jgi:hypothetical protein
MLLLLPGANKSKSFDCCFQIKLCPEYLNLKQPGDSCMCKVMLVTPVNKMVDPTKNNQKKWRTEEEERNKGSLTPLPPKKNPWRFIKSY